MNIYFENLDSRYAAAMPDFLALHGLSEKKTADAVKITFETAQTPKIKVTLNCGRAVISVNKPYQIFRGITLLKQYGKNDFGYEEPVVFETCGAMFDGSQASSLMNIASCKKMMLYLASMGYNVMMLYCEDCYELDGEPYFGNMRPRYSKNDFRLLDDYAYSLGIELIPCIQTLGHMTEAIKRPPYAEISDRPDILMADDERVYDLIDKMLETMSDCFRTRRIHVGLDEAWDLGLGNYLRKNGYHPAAEIMARHAERVNKIAEKHGMKPMMWEDMFFRTKSRINEYYDAEVSFSENDRGFVPEGMSIIYWDYYHGDKESYSNHIKESKKICDNVIFAGCARNVRTFGSHLYKTILTTDAALSACKEHGINEVFATVWGDDHRESSTFAVLPGLQYFAEHMYSMAESIDEKHLRERFFACTGMKWEALADITYFEYIPGYNEKISNYPFTRACIWQDILLGLCDSNMLGMDMSEHFAALAERMCKYAKEYPQFKTFFEFYAALGDAVEKKQYMGIALADMYKNGDKDGLRHAAEEELPELYRRMCNLRKAHRDYFFWEYKPIGWEILDIRYGGAIMRIDTAIMRIKSYLSGDIKRLDELEELRLSFTGKEGEVIPGVLTYQMLCSASRL